MIQRLILETKLRKIKQITLKLVKSIREKE